LVIATAFSVPAEAQRRRQRPPMGPPAAAAMAAKAGDDAKPAIPPPEEVFSTTEHQVRIGAQTVAYTATAGNYILKEEDGTPKASFFFVAYTKAAVEDPGERPVLFSFNGGPGSSSVWLHLGLFGPKRVEMTPEGWAPPPPYELVDNEFSLLDVADLVFIDPITTGYSRAVPGEDDGQFHGVHEDIDSVAEFVRLWVTRNERWASPKFLAGESYGTTRAAGLVNRLQERHGMYINGVVLISSILNFQTASFDEGNDLAYPLFLPTYTATAWYHGQLSEQMQAKPLTEVLDEVREFAGGDYPLALLRGARLSDEKRAETRRLLARFTGLSEEYVESNDLRIPIFRFVKELLRGEGRTVGRLDSRFQGFDRDSAGEGFDFDPSMAAITGPYTATLNDYVRRDLGYKTDLPYEILTGRVHPWNFGDYSNRYVNVAADLRQAMAQNPALRVFVASGYYDLATPFFATDYTFDHLGLPAGEQDRVETHYFEAGHMMYIRLAELMTLKQELAAFVARAAPADG
jgi:carboxypeptidase C (cathepsin A)